jgi:WD40-like Beta Propeller Repeat
MKGRDLLILAAVLLVGGFAVADSFRGSAFGDEGADPETAPETAPPPPPTTLAETGPQPQPEAPEGWPRGLLDGELVFTDGRDCRVRVIALPGGRERPTGAEPVLSSCELWAAPITDRIAIGVGPPSNDTVPFRFLDLARAGRDLGGYRALFGFIVWSPDGQRAAWCGRSRTGFDLEVGGAARRLPECPAAYTPEGGIAFARGNELVAGGRTLVRASGGITFVHFGSDGSVAVVVEGRRVERYRGGRLQQAFDLPAEYEGQTPELSPDNCGALFGEGGTIRVVDVGCLGSHFPAMPGTAAVWSPDGQWIASAGMTSIGFRPVSGGMTVEWPAQASQLFWR